MSHPAESYRDRLARDRVLRPDDVRDLWRRWLAEAGSGAGDLPKFRRWLVRVGAMTEYQLTAVDRGHADQLVIGPYRILDRIARGRMAGVYRAVHDSGPTVAIKVLPPSKAMNPQILARFRREARLARKLKHPNIVRTFQSGQVGGLHFLAMEYLDGETLEEVLARRGTLPPAEAVRLVYQALLGLQQIHENGLVHRDLKPANLALVGGRPDSTLQATVKILDIGTGKALFDEGGRADDLTNEGDVLGTPEYMAPEQARDSRTADVRADVYSLGCVLYHALTGQPPFRDKNAVRLLVRVAKEPHRPARELNPAVPEGLDQILDGLLAKDPAKRYPTPERAERALQGFLTAGGAEAVAIEADPRMSRFLKWLAEESDDQGPGVEVERVAAHAPPPLPRNEEHGKVGLSRRDFAMVAIGVGGLAVLTSVSLAVWAIVRAFSRRDEPEPPESRT